MEIVYAYRYKDDPDNFGLLDAVDYSDARGHLGKDCLIKRVVLPDGDMMKLLYDQERLKAVVDSALSGKHQTTGAAIKIGDRVRTTAGTIGTIVELQDRSAPHFPLYRVVDERGAPLGWFSKAWLSLIRSGAPDEIRPPWAFRMLAEQVAKHDECTRYPEGDDCRGSGDCLTEWCPYCYASWWMEMHV